MRLAAAAAAAVTAVIAVTACTTAATVATTAAAAAATAAIAFAAAAQCCGLTEIYAAETDASAAAAAAAAVAAAAQLLLPGARSTLAFAVTTTLATTAHANAASCWQTRWLQDAPRFVRWYCQEAVQYRKIEQRN
eukprot:14048-Heterococcus_DN1.PRE.1